MKSKSSIISLLLAVSLSAHAAYYSDDSSGSVGIPDNNLIGITPTAGTASGSAWSVSSVTLTFNLAGGFGTDLVGYLRAGNTLTSPVFDFSSYMNDYATLPGGGQSFTFDFGNTPGPSGMSAAFNGIDPNTTWTLFFADQSAGGTTTLNSWSLNIEAVPEPVNVALGIVGGIGAVGWLVRWRKGQKQKLGNEKAELLAA